jgi:murein DD-endopeptidase MepM/ murein hydrolase activator NlpD
MRAPLATAATPHGAYGYWRARSQRHHAGVDLGAPAGAVVVAPEAMLIGAVLDASGLTSARAFRGVGLRGYGPGALIGVGDSGYVHVLGHLATAGLPRVGDLVAAGAVVGTVSRLRHVHWEVRRPDRHPWPTASRLADTVDPLSLVRAPNPLDLVADPLALRPVPGQGRLELQPTPLGGWLWVAAAIVLAHVNRRR